jgi:DNA-directed RNA polymerase subunit H (RpoH/RPB5)
MHTLQPKHTKLSPQEAKKLLLELNISLSQLPKIIINDPALSGFSEKCEVSDIIKIERILGDKKSFYYRVVSV